MSEKSTLKPVSTDERIHVLDALRGFAIFGILIINIRVFTGYSYFSENVKAELLLSDWNTAFDWLHTVFFAGKFYTLFSLLFGVGFAIQFLRASSTDKSFVLHFSRRLFFLMIIGIVHLWGIWFSDILVIYALCGYMLILFKDFSDRSLLFTAFIILALSGVHAWYLHITESNYTNDLYMILSQAWNSVGLPKASTDAVTFRMDDLVEVIQSDSWSTVLTFNYIGPLLRGYIISYDARILRVLGIFIIGLWMGRQLMLHKLHENRSLLWKILIGGFLIGLPLNLFFAMETDQILGISNVGLIKGILEPFGYVALTSGYISAFMLIYLKGLGNTLDTLFNSVGKSALTNYILQSIIGILLFYNAGLGLGEYLGSAALTIATILIFIFQILISYLWLSYFKFGPLEWIWRVLTYGTLIDIRKHKAGNSL